MEKKNHLNIAVNASGAALNICILCTHFTLVCQHVCHPPGVCVLYETEHLHFPDLVKIC